MKDANKSEFALLVEDNVSETEKKLTQSSCFGVLYQLEMKDEDLFWAKNDLYTKQNKRFPVAEH